MRIIFMGSPAFSVPTLKALIASDHEVIAVYSQPPRAAGRGKAIRPTPIHIEAETAGIEVRTPLNFKDANDVAAFAALNADLVVVIAYGLILPQSVLDAPKLGCVNLHASLLPRWRGAAPIHRAIMAGDDKTGICLMKMEAGLDTGSVYAQDSIQITPEMTTGVLHNHLAEMSAKLLMAHIDALDEMHPIPQAKEGITYAAKIDKNEAIINWAQSAEHVRRHIHGLSPFPGAWTTLDGERIKFHHVDVVDGNGAPGTILDDKMTIACATGAIRPISIQRAGKRIMTIDDALRGMQNIKGKTFGVKS